MKAKQVREMSIQELKDKIYSLKEQLFNLRYQSQTGRLEKPSQIRNFKRDIARINTIIKEKTDGQAAAQKKD